MNPPEFKVARSAVKKTTITVRLEQAQYDAILREAVGAPDNAEVRVENDYGGDITITWTTTEYSGDDE